MFRKLVVASDLTEISLNEALMALWPHPMQPDMLFVLVVPEGMGVIAGRLAERAGRKIRVVVLPREIMEQDAWAVSLYEDETLWSPGA